MPPISELAPEVWTPDLRSLRATRSPDSLTARATRALTTVCGGLIVRGDCTKKPMAAVGGVFAGRWWCLMSPADRVIRWSTALAVLGVAAVGAVASYEHAYDLVELLSRPVDQDL